MGIFTKLLTVTTSVHEASNPFDYPYNESYAYQKFMDKAIKIVGDHLYSAGFGADDFAREMGVSRTKLFTKLKEITGDTPADFIQSLRLNAAAKMLREDMELNVSEISDRLGFSSPKYFRKCFKDKFRQTPMEFRKGMPDSSDAEGNKENI